MKDKKDIQYKILKSEACGHTIEYRMVKKEHQLEKARIDEGLSPREKMKAREARSSKEKEPRELSPEQYETGKKIARTKAVTATGEKQRKETLKDVLHTHKQNAPKSPSKEDLEYPMAASEEECECEDKTKKCECEDKEIKKREKFYIQKIQELRKARLDPNAMGQFAKEQNQKLSRQRIAEKVQQIGQGARNVGQQIGQGARNVGQQIGQGARNVGQQIGQARAAANEARALRSASDVLNNPGARSVARGALGTAGRILNPVGKLALAGEAGYQLGDKVINPLMDKYVWNKPTNVDTSEVENQAKQNYAKSPAARDRQTAKATTSAAATNTPENNRAISPKNSNELAQQEAKDMAATEASNQKYDMKNPFKVENAKNFKDAFDQARKETGGGGNVFEYGGKKFHTYTQDEFKNPEKSGVPTDNKFYKDWQAKKDVTGPGAYYANKMNPAPTAAPAVGQSAAPAVGQSAAAQKQPDSFEQNFPKTVNRKEGGQTVKTFSDGKKQIINQ